MMTACIVEAFEVVQIEAEHGALAVRTRAERDTLAELFEEQTAVGKPGDLVIEGEGGNLFFSFLLMGDIAYLDKKAGHAMDFNRGGEDNPPEHTAVFSEELNFNTAEGFALLYDVQHSVAVADVSPDAEFLRGFAYD